MAGAGRLLEPGSLRPRQHSETVSEKPKQNKHKGGKKASWKEPHSA